MAYTFTADYSFSGIVSVEVEADTPEEAEEKGRDMAFLAIEGCVIIKKGDDRVVVNELEFELESTGVYVPYEYEVAEMNRVS